MTDVQRRFLRAILERVPIERIVEVHAFPPMRQGVLETGIAVVAAVQVEAEGEVQAVEAEAVEAEACDPTEQASVDEMPPADVAPPADEAPAPRAPRERLTVYTARYRVTLKGPERGKWELSVVEEADAPLLTVEMVVRGVQRRAGDGMDPVRLDPAGLRELLEAPAAP